MSENRFKLWPTSTGSSLLTSPYRQDPTFTPARARLARMREGAGTLVLVARTVWADQALRRFYLRVAIAQSIATLALGVLAVVLVVVDDEDDRPGRRAERAAKTAVLAAEGHEKDPKPGRSIVIKGDKSTIVIGPAGVAVSSNEAAPAPAASEGAPEGEAALTPGSAGAGSTSATPAARAMARAAARLAAAAAAAEARGNANDDNDDDNDDGDTKQTKPEARPDPRAVIATDEENDNGDVPPAAARGRGDRLLAFWAKLGTLYGTLVAVGWCVIALSRDYHDAISREASLRLGLPPEDPPLVPRVRLNLPWVKTRLKRRLRGFLLFTLGVPPLWALSFFVVLPLDGIDYFWDVFDMGSVISRLYGLLAAAWGAYWLIVFTGAKTALAWADEHVAPEPWFLRLWGAFTRRMPAVIAWLPSGYGRAWTSMSRQIFAPAICFERAPYEFSGLAALRLLGSVPGLYPFVRPLVPVAAALLASRHAPPSPPSSATPLGPGGGWPPGRPAPHWLLTLGAVRRAFRPWSSPL